MNRTANSLTLIALLLFGARWATAQEPNTFDPDPPSSTTWHSNDNWTYGTIPVASDNDLIPEDLTCKITGDPAVALTVEVEDGAKLYAVSNILTVYGANSSGTVDSVTVDGTLYLDVAPMGSEGELHFLTPAGETMYPQLTGSGDVVGTQGIIAKHGDDDSEVILEIGGTVTLSGLLEINYLNLDLGSGTTLLTDYGQIDISGSIGAVVHVTGAGAVNVDNSFGSIELHRCRFWNFSGTVDVTEGGIWLYGYLGSYTNSFSDAAITIDGGLIWCGSDMSCDDTTIAVEGDTPGLTVTGDFDMKETNATSSLTQDDGWIFLFGATSISDTTVTLNDGKLQTVAFDSDDCAITVGGAEFELNGAYTGTRTAFTVNNGGLLDINNSFSNAGSLTFSNGTITVAVDKTATFEKP